VTIAVIHLLIRPCETHQYEKCRLLTVSICKVGDCGFQTYQTDAMLKRAKVLEFTTVSPILYIHLKFDYP